MLNQPVVALSCLCKCCCRWLLPLCIQHPFRHTACHLQHVMTGVRKLGNPTRIQTDRLLSSSCSG